MSQESQVGEHAGRFGSCPISNGLCVSIAGSWAGFSYGSKLELWLGTPHDCFPLSKPPSPTCRQSTQL